MNLNQAEEKIISAVPKFWQSRALEMFRHMTVSNSQATTVDRMRVPDNWPINGDITFKRDADGKRVWLGIRGKSFKAGVK